MEAARAGMGPARGGAWGPAVEVLHTRGGISKDSAGALTEDSVEALAVDSVEAGVLAEAGVSDRDVTRSVTIISIVNIYS
jgi:hypothetical protein